MARSNPAIVLMISVAATFAFAGVACQRPAASGGSLGSIPGAQTAAGMLASASDGMSRYLAPNGPIQPAITAIGGLPLRAGELANSGITSISSGFNRGARRLSQAAGQGGQIRMPGLDTAASMMPASFARIGDSVQGMIRSKNNFIMGQAERGIEAASRMGQAMRQGLQVRSSGPMEHMGQMVSQTHEMISKGGQQIKGQMEQSLSRTMGRMKTMQGMGADVGQQISGYGRTLAQGAQGVVGQVRQTGQQLVSQMQQNHNKNMSGVSGMLGSLHGSMGQMGKDMQQNLSGLQRQASNVAQQLTNSLQSVAQLPMNVMQSLMQSKGSSGSSGGRY